ncbi:MAG: hypothetical protein ACOZBL_02770 [Patescibacteria group bacterium]
MSLYEYIQLALEDQKYSKVTLYFNYFKNSLTQLPTSMQIFPMSK